MREGATLFRWGDRTLGSRWEAEAAVREALAQELASRRQHEVVDTEGARYRCAIEVALVRDPLDELREIKEEHDRGLHPFFDPDCAACVSEWAEVQ